MNTWIVGKDLIKNHYQIKKFSYSELNSEDTDKDYAHTQKVFEELQLKNLCDYHNCLKTLETNVLKYMNLTCPFSFFFFAPGLAWQACLKKRGVKLELLTNIAMLLMVEKGITGGICHAIHRYAKTYIKYMKNYDKNIIPSYLVYLDVNNLYGWVMSQKLPVNGFE